jgi:hypothetical protein
MARKPGRVANLIANIIILAIASFGVMLIAGSAHASDHRIPAISFGVASAVVAVGVIIVWAAIMTDRK